jgi:O-antigen/teichoic acid export membrane protein
VLVLLTALLSATARDLLDLMTKGLFIEAAPVVAWTALAVLFQGVYLLTSIGLNLTKQTRYYPVSTMSAAAANVALNFVLIPQFGLIGAAWANTAAYALQALLAFMFSQRFYPMTYEYGRLARIAVVGAVAYVVGAGLPSAGPIVDIALRGMAVFAVFAGLLWMTGFFKAEELAVLATLRRARASDRAAVPVAETTEMAGEIISTELPEQPLQPREARVSRFK